MPLKNYINITSTSVGFLLIGMLVVSFKLYNTSKQNENLKEKLSLESTLHQNQISEILRRYDSLDKITDKTKKNSELSENFTKKELAVKAIPKSKTAREAKLHAVNLNVRGVRKVGKDVVETNNSTKMDQLRICFTLEQNKLITPGNKRIKVEIRNPKNRLLNLDDDPDRLIKEVYYNRFATDACLFVNLYQHEIIVGTYTINVLYDNEIIAATNFRVN